MHRTYYSEPQATHAQRHPRSNPPPALASVTRLRCIAALMAAMIGVPVLPAQQSDSAATAAPLFTHSDAWLAAGFAVGIIAFVPFDEKIAVYSQSPSVQTSSRTSVSDAFNWFGGPGVILLSVGTYGVGRIAGSRPVSEIGLRATEAIILGSAITGVVKGALGRQRPYVDIHDPNYFVFAKGYTDDAYTSLPSGHTTAAFAFASAVTEETAHFWPRQTWWVATLTYGSATMVGAARIYSNNHWTTDVVAGAMVGTFSGLVVTRWHRAHPNNKLDRWLLPKSVAPTRGGIAVSWGATF